MQVYKDGIEKTIKESQLQVYKEKGYMEVSSKPEPQPAQEVEVADDFVVKPAKKKKATKKGV